MRMRVLSGGGFAIERVFPSDLTARGGLFVVPHGTRVIDACAFENVRTILRRVVLPVTLTHIMREAFMDCGLLERIVLPEGLRVVHDRAFYGCRKLRYVDVQSRSIDYMGVSWHLCEKIEVVHGDDIVIECIMSQSRLHWDSIHVGKVIKLNSLSI
jgi:hypothetical protein